MSNRTTGPLVRPGEHLPALDGLRGLAILLVLLIHFTVMQPLTAMDRAVFALARSGWVGVDLFFVLSGFLITGILHDTRDRPGTLRTFYARRLLRIFPLYYGFLLAVFVAGPLLAPGSAWLAQLRVDQAWHWAYLSNVLAALRGWTAAPGLGHFWSLAIEEQFYLVWPLVVLGLSVRRLVSVCLALLGVSLVARVALLAADASPIAVYALTFTRWDGLVIGALVALAARSRWWSGWVTRWTGPVLGASGVAWVAMAWAHPYRSHYGPAMQVIGYPLVALFFGALLVRTLAAAPSSPLHRALRRPWLGFLGRYSYGIYVLHGPLTMWLLERGVTPRLLPPVWGSALPGQAVFWAATSAGTLALAIPVFHLWERPFLSLKRRFPYASPAAQSEAVGTAPAARAA